VTERVARVPREEVRRRVLEAAEQLYAQRGIDATSIEDVARAAGFTKGAVFSNFATKDELVAAIMDERVAARLGEVVRTLDTEAGAADLPGEVGRMFAQRLREDDGGSLLVLEYLLRAARDPSTGTEFVESRRAQRDLVATLIEQQAGLRGMALRLPPSTLALALLALTSAVAAERRADPDGVDPGALGDIVSALLS
jgi:AcrR family transcriptional regulator